MGRTNPHNRDRKIGTHVKNHIEKKAEKTPLEWTACKAFKFGAVHIEIQSAPLDSGKMVYSCCLSRISAGNGKASKYMRKEDLNDAVLCIEEAEKFLESETISV